jgi:hypothetical protein
MPKRQPCPWRGTVGYYSTEGRPAYCPRPKRWRAMLRAHAMVCSLPPQACWEAWLDEQRKAKGQRGG